MQELQMELSWGAGTGLHSHLGAFKVEPCCVGLCFAAALLPSSFSHILF